MEGLAIIMVNKGNHPQMALIQVFYPTTDATAACGNGQNQVTLLSRSFWIYYGFEETT